MTKVFMASSFLTYAGAVNKVGGDKVDEVGIDEGGADNQGGAVNKVSTGPDDKVGINKGGMVDPGGGVDKVGFLTSSGVVNGAIDQGGAANFLDFCRLGQQGWCG